MAEYNFIYDDVVLMESVRRYKMSLNRGLISIIFKLFIGLPNLYLAFDAFRGHVWVTGIVYTTIAVIIFMWPLYTNWLTKQQFMKLPIYNEEMAISLSSEGVMIVNSIHNSKTSWAAYTKVCRFRDGFLLFQGLHTFNWLPDESLVAGTIQDVMSLIQNNIRDYQEI